jgi:hypothetical protein
MKAGGFSSRRLFAVQQFVKDTIILLAKAQVEFVVVGGISAVLQGAPLPTIDLDICYRRTPENIARLVKTLAPLRPRPRGFPPDLPFIFDDRTIQLGSNFTLEIGDESLDLLGVMSGIGRYEQIIHEAQDLMVGPCRVKVLSLAQLIATKEAAGRPKDLAALPMLRAALDLLERQEQSHDEPPPGP